jgi:hypothetical protein
MLGCIYSFIDFLEGQAVVAFIRGKRLTLGSTCNIYDNGREISVKLSNIYVFPKFDV